MNSQYIGMFIVQIGPLSSALLEAQSRVLFLSIENNALVGVEQRKLMMRTAEYIVVCSGIGVCLLPTKHVQHRARFGFTMAR